MRSNSAPDGLLATPCSYTGRPVWYRVPPPPFPIKGRAKTLHPEFVALGDARKKIQTLAAASQRLTSLFASPFRLHRCRNEEQDDDVVRSVSSEKRAGAQFLHRDARVRNRRPCVTNPEDPVLIAGDSLQALSLSLSLWVLLGLRCIPEEASVFRGQSV